MASHLRRAFKTDPDVFVFNDLRLVFEGEVAQIDHLVLHRGGMVLIESRSVSGEVLVNERAEWVRWTDSHHEGMLSPVEQARRHEAVLRAMLGAKSERLRDRTPLETERERSGLDWPIDFLIVASDECRITREVDVPELCRVDQATGVIDAIVERRQRGHRSLNVLHDDGVQRLSPAEMGRLVQCLSSSHTPGQEGEESGDEGMPDSRDGTPSALPEAPEASESLQPLAALKAPEVLAPPVIPEAALPEIAPPAAVEPPAPPAAEEPVAAARGAARPAREEPPPFCGDCGSLEVHMRYARTSHPYYFRCDRCGGITPARWECSVCGTPARIVKRGNDFFRECKTCNTSEYFFTNPRITRTV